MNFPVEGNTSEVGWSFVTRTETFGKRVALYERGDFGGNVGRKLNSYIFHRWAVPGDAFVQSKG